MRVFIYILLLNLLAGCYGLESTQSEQILDCFFQGLSSEDVNRIAYIQSFDDAEGKLRDLNTHFFKSIELSDCGIDHQILRRLDGEEVVSRIQIRAMSEVLSKSNNHLKKEMESIVFDDSKTLDCSQDLGSVVDDLNGFLDGRFTVLVSNEYSKLRVVGKRIVEGKHLGLLLVQVRLIFGFEYYVTPEKNVVIVPIRSGLFSNNQVRCYEPELRD